MAEMSNNFGMSKKYKKQISFAKTVVKIIQSFNLSIKKP